MSGFLIPSSGTPALSSIMTTGVVITKGSLVWEIQNFSTLIKKDAMINAQRIYLDVTENGNGRSGQKSKWVIKLRTEVRGGKKWIGVYYKVKKRPSKIGDFLYSRMNLTIPKNKNGITKNGDTGLNDVKAMDTERGFAQVIEVSGAEDRSILEIHIVLKLYSPATLICRHQEVDPPAKDTQLRIDMKVKAGKDIGTLLQNPVSGDVKLRSNDGKEFIMPRGILTVRSPVFEAMFRSDMMEANGGVIWLPDMTGASLETLLAFFYTGDLNPNWGDSGVVLELTNAAAKYQLQDLLYFLDVMLGSVCDLGNVAPLLTLANQLGLKRAEEELTKFVKEEGTSSPEKLFQIMNVVSGMGSLGI